jgi:hypothetical protein
VVAVAKVNTTERQMSNYFQKLWKINSESGPPILGRYELQNCASNGPSPFQITCVLWSSGSSRTASLLSKEFQSSNLFQIIEVTNFELSTSKSAAEIETYACLEIAVPPKPTPGAWEAISIPDSTLSALSRSGNATLETAARDYVAAANEQSLKAMTRALAKGVTACHRLGLRTAKQF